MGEDLKRDQTIKFPFVRTLGKNYKKSDLIVTNVLYYSEATVAPSYPGPQVMESCRVRSDLTGVDRAKLVMFTGADGKTYYDLEFNLVVCTAAANLKFSLEIDGVEMGSVEATYV